MVHTHAALLVRLLCGLLIPVAAEDVHAGPDFDGLALLDQAV